jgi:cobalt/nickel transport system permease protein
MTHLHIPDGILPVKIWMLGMVIMMLALGVSAFRIRAADLMKKVPLLGAMSAVMLVVMSLEILPLAYHVNLSVVAGILLGPSLGFLAAFITNLMLAFMGHGGITVIGLNTLLLGSEAVLGHVLFYLFRKRFPIFWRAAGVTVITLLITTLALISIVAVSHVDPDLLRHAGEHGDGVEGLGWIIEAAITGAVVKFISQVKPELLAHALHRDTIGRPE